MSLEIVIKTCDGEGLHGSNSNRFCKYDKKTLILKCISSIIVAADVLDNKIKINVIDDNSSEELVDSIKKIFSNVSHENELFFRNKRDYNESTLQYFQVAKDSSKTFVYCVEDDYLHLPHSLSEMIIFYKHAFDHLGKNKDVAIHPFDDPNNYDPSRMIPSYIIQHNNNIWRTNQSSTCTFFTTPGVINRGWQYIEAFSKNYRKDPVVNEDTTINNIWRGKGVQLFTPVPSLAMHMQFEENRDKMIDWKQLWDDTPNF